MRQLNQPYRQLTAAKIIILVAATMLVPAFAAADGVLFVVNDRVGIGTEMPASGATLHVKAATGGGAIDSIFLENNAPARIRLTNTSVSNSATQDQTWTLNSNGNLRFTAGVDGAEATLDASGNFNVIGSISVNNTTLIVPDYIFESDYPLTPLDELKVFLEENQHLPDMPSAQDVSQHGLNMTEMQLRLLQKVEELTLYTLQQHETIKQLKARLVDLEQKSHP